MCKNIWGKGEGGGALLQYKASSGKVVDVINVYMLGYIYNRYDGER